MSNKELLLDLQSKVDAWIEARATRNISSLSRKTGVPHSTLRRMLQGEATITIEKIIPVLEEVCEKKEIVSFIETHFPHVNAAFFRILKESLNDNYQVFDSSLKTLYKDPKYFHVLALTLGSGATREEICDQLGQLGLDILDDLVKKEAVSLDSNNMYQAFGHQKDLVTSDVETLLALNKNSLDIFSRRKDGVWAANYIGAATMETLLKAQELIDNAFQSASELIDKEGSSSINKEELVPFSLNLNLGRIGFERNGN